MPLVPATKTMVYEYVDGVFITVHSTKDPTEDEWETYLKFYKESAKTCTRALVITNGGGPNAGQRNKMNLMLKGVPMVAAICTNATVVRGIVTALNWFNPNVRAFPRDDATEALRYLKVGDTAMPRLLLEVAKLRRSVPEQT